MNPPLPMKRIFHLNGVSIVRHCKGCYSMRYLGVMIFRCACREMAVRYYCREFAPEDETR